MTSEEKLKRIAEIYDTVTNSVSTHARHNLEGVLIDIDRQWEVGRDEICLNTIRRVIKQLAEIEKLLPL